MVQSASMESQNDVSCNREQSKYDRHQTRRNKAQSEVQNARECELQINRQMSIEQRFNKDNRISVILNISEHFEEDRTQVEH